jgi:hypothetical protein
VRPSAAPRGRIARLLRVWSVLHPEQRVAAVAASLLIVSTFGPFSFVEAAEILAAGAVLALLRQRAEGREFHLPFGDGTVIFGAGVWCGVLIATRMFDRPPGMTVLALVCALLLAAAGLRERAKRAPDDIPTPLERQAVGVPVVPARATPAAATPAGPATPPARRRPLRRKSKPADEDATRQLSFEEDPTVALGGDGEDGDSEQPPRG